MMNVDLAKEGRFASSRTKPYKYSVDSWKRWCDTNDCELFVLTEEIVDHDVMGICWQRWYIFDLLESNGIEYEQVLSVDDDTIIHHDCPNFFEMTDYKFSSVLTDGDYEWVNRAINGYSKLFFDKEFCIPTFEFFQTGFVIINKKHKDFFDRVFDFYDKNKEEIIRSYDVLLTGSDISIMNCLRKEFGVELNLLP